jgi:hypothetical protein
MKLSGTVSLLAGVACLSPATFQQDALSEARQLAETATAYIEKLEPRVFADVAIQGRPAAWKEFATEEDRRKADLGQNLNANAYLWQRDGKVLRTTFTLQSPSRDWALVSLLTYRPDGTLAVLASTMNSFYGDITVKREYVFDGRGILRKKSVKAFEIGTDKPKDLKALGRDFFDMQPPIYRRVRDLPFVHLLDSQRVQTTR